jgi:dihydrofolate synthase/folylpolyglutamate synthase
MDYQQFLEHIYIRHSTNVTLGLERMHLILQKMGNPNMALKGIHLAGTNGKGSTSAITESLLLSHGCTTGLNTSPHLIDYTERFRLNGSNIATDELMALYHRYAHHFDDTQASFFEITTALAFMHFVDRNVDSAVIEVGLGGRLDGTNPFNATVSVITSISIDHPKSLGDTIEKIAFEKAGIIKDRTPVVVGNLKEEALLVIEKQAKLKNAPIYLYGKDYLIENVRLDADGTHFDYLFPKYDFVLRDLCLNLLGYHQADNCAIALTALILYFDILDREVSHQMITEALVKVNWMGRLQVLSKTPPVVIDGAHNEEGVATLVKNLLQIFPHKRYHFLVAILRDKRLDTMIREICSVAEVLYIAKNSSERAADLAEQVQVAQEMGTKYYAQEDIVSSAKKCLATLDPEKDMMVITGSLYTIAEILKHKDEIFFMNHG